jgi:signal transduction histidine kinase
MIVTCEVSDQRWPPESDAAAYFVVAEALTNVIKHADAGEATVSIRERRGNLCIEIREDGRGGRACAPAVACAGWPTASMRPTGRRRSTARPAPARACARRSRSWAERVARSR